MNKQGIPGIPELQGIPEIPELEHIFKKYKLHLNLGQSFINTIEQSNKLSQEELILLKQQINNDNQFQKKDILKLNLNFDIFLKYINKNNKTVNSSYLSQQNKNLTKNKKQVIEQNNFIELGLINDRYFINDLVQISKEFIENYNKNKNNKQLLQLLLKKAEYNSLFDVLKWINETK